jgi:hypothetical protein
MALSLEYMIRLDWLGLLSNALLSHSLYVDILLALCEFISVHKHQDSFESVNSATNRILIVLDAKDNRITLLDVCIYVRMSYKQNFYDC